MGVHISFVRYFDASIMNFNRSLNMDRWKLKELKNMELGGNKNAWDFYEIHGMIIDGKPNHRAPLLASYK
jgi:hypothetical protein